MDIENFNPKKFRIIDLKKAMKEDVQFISETKFCGDLYLNICDCGDINLHKGSENLYLTFEVEFKDDKHLNSGEIKIYTKEDHKTVKQIAIKLIQAR